MQKITINIFVTACVTLFCGWLNFAYAICVTDLRDRLPVGISKQIPEQMGVIAWAENKVAFRSKDKKSKNSFFAVIYAYEPSTRTTCTNALDVNSGSDQPTLSFWLKTETDFERIAEFSGGLTRIYADPKITQAFNLIAGKDSITVEQFESAGYVQGIQTVYRYDVTFEQIFVTQFSQFRNSSTPVGQQLNSNAFKIPATSKEASTFMGFQFFVDIDKKQGVVICHQLHTLPERKVLPIPNGDFRSYGHWKPSDTYLRKLACKE